jgi:pantoate--beta-alanine ligase
MESAAATRIALGAKNPMFAISPIQLSASIAEAEPPMHGLSHACLRGRGKTPLRPIYHADRIGGTALPALLVFQAPPQLHENAMARGPLIVQTVKTLDRAIGNYRDAGATLALVPTMGALHAGHLALVKRARRRADRVAVSIFVNPAQFAPNEDFASYPRTFDTDIAALQAEGVDLVWAPPREVMYPDGFATSINVKGPAVADLEDRFRPHFFGGVATVVAKLFAQVRPDFAVFGEKDYQQLKTVTRMAADLDLKVTVIGVPTVREQDGLALSSRNVYLSPAERAAAPALYRTLKDSAARIAAGEPIALVMSEGSIAIEETGFAVDYFEARHAETLRRAETVAAGPLRLLVAARIGKTRLIDNIAA